jgi:hypothetical protein
VMRQFCETWRGRPVFSRIYSRAKLDRLEDLFGVKDVNSYLHRPIQAVGCRSASPPFCSSEQERKGETLEGLPCGDGAAVKIEAALAASATAIDAGAFTILHHEDVASHAHDHAASTYVQKD